MKHLITFEGYNNRDIEDIKACVQEIADEYSFEFYNNRDRVVYVWNHDGDYVTTPRLEITDKLLLALDKCAKKLDALDKTYTIKIEVGVASINNDGSVDDAEFTTRTFMNDGRNIGTMLNAIMSDADELYGRLYANAYSSSDTDNFRNRVVKFIESMDIQVMKDRVK